MFPFANMIAVLTFLVAFMPSTALSLFHNNRPCAVDDTNSCIKVGPITFHSVRKVGIDPNTGNQTCIEKCVWNTRRYVTQQRGYECGKCQMTSIVDQSTNELSIISCTLNNITITGSDIDKYKPGYYFTYTDTKQNVCGRCSPLFRKIDSIINHSDDIKIFTTSMATFDDIFASNLYNNNNDIAKLEIETFLNCTELDGSVPVNKTVAASIHVLPPLLLENREDINALTYLQHEDNNSSVTDSSLKSIRGSCSSDWFIVKSDGRCQYTDCYIGIDEDVDPSDCFSCSKKGIGCDNGCGTTGLSFDGNLFLFDFGKSCCNHDFCYSGTIYSKFDCDNQFLMNMIRQCPPNKIPPILSQLFQLGPISKFLIKNSCPLTATLFYALVTIGGEISYRNGQSDQINYNKEDICIAKVSNITNR